jgi:hypothetical protein
MQVAYQEGLRLFLSIECLDGNYEDFRITMFKLRVKYCMREYSCLR